MSTRNKTAIFEWCLKKANGYYCHKAEFASYKMKVYWNAVKSPFLPPRGNTCTFSGMLFPWWGAAKQERHKHRSTAVLMTAISMQVSGAKWYFNQKCTEPILWFAHPWDVHNSPTALCKMSGSYKTLLGFYCSVLQTLISRKIVPER